MEAGIIYNPIERQFCPDKQKKKPGNGSFVNPPAGFLDQPGLKFCYVTAGLSFF